MKIALVGSTGFVGSKVLEEARRRGHSVTAISRNPDTWPSLAGVTTRKADILGSPRSKRPSRAMMW